MIFEIGDFLVTEDVLESPFICDLNACKGACCIEGDGGAPVNEDEKKILTENLEAILPYMSEEGKKTIAENSLFYQDQEGEWLIELSPSKACVFASWDEKGHLGCSVEKAFLAGKTDFQKPISCHLYPIRVSKIGGKTALNYHRWKICKAACALGKKEKIPLYLFLKRPLQRAFGQEFWGELAGVAQALKEEKNK